MERPQPSQDLLKQLRSERGGYAPADRSDKGVGVTPRRPVEHHRCRAEDGAGDFVGGAGAVLLEEGCVDEDVAETNEVPEVYLVVAVDAAGI